MTHSILLETALAGSRYVQRLLSADPALAQWLTTHWQAPLSREDLQIFLNAAPITGESVLYRRLRQLRRRVIAHTAARDLGGLADLAEVTATMTALAEIAINAAVTHLDNWLKTDFGTPMNGIGIPQPLIVVGMGKLGGGELNVSSDIDLIFVYPEAGETSGPHKLSNHEYFLRLGRKVIGALSEQTADGFVFRVDMRLRPDGDSGALVVNFAELESYLVTRGREWERYAWIKARPVFPGTDTGYLGELAKLTRPFVFRKYLDFGAIESLRGLHAEIRREVTRRDLVNNVKLGPGGIREIEFIAQAFQLIRGGRDPRLQQRPTCVVLGYLGTQNTLSAKCVQELTEAYEFLRRLEHRLQYLEDQQTHTLPTAVGDCLLIAQTMGYADFVMLQTAIDHHRERVSHHFDSIFAAPEIAQNGLDDVWTSVQPRAESGEATDDPAVLQRLTDLGFQDAASAYNTLRQFAGSQRMRSLPDASCAIIAQLVPKLLQYATQHTASANAALARGVAFLEAIARRSGYLALLNEHNDAAERVARLLATSSWAAEYLTQHPILLDELIAPQMQTAPDWRAFREVLSARLAGSAGDAEHQIDILREEHHAQVFRLLMLDLDGRLPLEQLSDHLSELADIMLQTTLDLCWSHTLARHPEFGHKTLHFAIIAYGKLGGKELGYASDLDIIFLYEDTHENVHEDTYEDAGEIYARLAQKLNTWLSSRTAAGILFETDLRLRPSGESGLLVSSVAAFEKYQRESAWVWEHQALTRARFCAGDVRIGTAFERIREDILRVPRDPAKLLQEVKSMRLKMSTHHPTPDDEFDIKQDRGGMIDIEFIVQYLVLAHAHAHPELTANAGNIALLTRAAGLGLIPADLAQNVVTAYREYRRLQHKLRLDGARYLRSDTAQVQHHIGATLALWRAVMEPSYGNSQPA